MPKLSKKIILIACFILAVGLLITTGIVISYRMGRQNTSAPQPSSSPSKSTEVSTQPEPKPTPPPATVSATPELAVPVADFKSRITKKSFGTFITPQNSPVQPEKFSGYHTGVDVEYGDTTDIVPVYAIASGTVTYSGFVGGYGGVVCIKSVVNEVARTILYGHLAPSALPALGASVGRGEQIGRLGQAYSAETDGERRHLHLSVLASSTVNLRGYVASSSQLGEWLDPLSLPF